MESGGSTSGLYVIDPFGDRQRLVTVYCDMETDAGGWTVKYLSFSMFLSLTHTFVLSVCECIIFYFGSIRQTNVRLFILSFFFVCQCISFTCLNQSVKQCLFIMFKPVVIANILNKKLMACLFELLAADSFL